MNGKSELICQDLSGNLKELFQYCMIVDEKLEELIYIRNGEEMKRTFILTFPLCL